MSYFGNYYLTGPDAQAAADWIFTNNMRKPVGETSYTCMLNAQAGVESDLTVSFIDGSSSAPWEPSFQVRFHFRQKKGFSISLLFCLYLLDRGRDFTLLPGADLRISLSHTFVKQSKMENSTQNSPIIPIVFAYYLFRDPKGIDQHTLYF